MSKDLRTLILGGTGFVGRHMVEACLAAGHAVTVLARGISPDALPAAVERLRGDRDEGMAGLAALPDRAWDACVDVSGYTPRQVRPSAECLSGRVGHYVFVSAVRVYGPPVYEPVDESHPLVVPADESVTEIDDRTYGPLKVACEAIVGEIFGERATILRPQVVVGPHDPTGRYVHWLEGDSFAPGDGSDFLQVIDVRDLARFTVKVIEDRLPGVFNLAGPRLSWAEFMKIAGNETPAWTMPSGAELPPLFRPPAHPLRHLMNVSSARARAAGLTLTSPAVTAGETRAALRSQASG